MGGIGNVVVNTIVRMFTRKAVSKAMKSSKKGKASRAPARRETPRARETAIKRTTGPEEEAGARWAEKE